MLQQEPRQEIIESFRLRRTRQWMATVPTVLVIALMFWIRDSGQAYVMGYDKSTVLEVGIGVILVALVFSLINWRCPACNKYLGKGPNPKFCSKCGVQLN